MLELASSALNNVVQGGRRSGGRRPNKADELSLDTDLGDKTWLLPSKPNEARLTIVQITDVYTLDNFASLKTMLRTIREKQGPNSTVISMLTGDFLSPYLLSSIDRGKGMMDALDAVPIDVVIWGNHEADIDHKTVCRHVKQFRGKWINTNMQDHEAMEHQIPYDIITIKSPDGCDTRKIGLVAVLSDDPKLYSHFKSPGAFGGAKIEDPWDTLRKYKDLLENQHHCDLVIPLQHLYVPDDHKTCREFDFPLILSGHDHHRVDQIVEGTRLIKPGMDGVYATVLEVIWDQANQEKPRIRSAFVETATFDPCSILKSQTDAAYDVLLPLRNTELIHVPNCFEPLSSANARGRVTTMGKFICTLIKDSLNQTGEKIDAVILMGGNIRGGEAYDIGSFFSLEMLEAEIKSDEIVGIVPIPGHVLAAGIEITHAGNPIPGWMQYDIGIQEEVIGGSSRVTTVGGKPIIPDKVYRVATKVSDLGNGQSPPFKEYFSSLPELLPSKGSYFNIQTELMGFFSKRLFRKLWDAIGKKIQPKMQKVASNPSLLAAEGNALGETLKKVESGLRLDVLDKTGDGVVSVEEIHAALRDLMGMSVHSENQTLAEYILLQADATGNGVVTKEDFEHFIDHFCAVLPGGVDEYYSRATASLTPSSALDFDDDDDDDGGLMF